MFWCAPNVNEPEAAGPLFCGAPKAIEFDGAGVPFCWDWKPPCWLLEDCGGNVNELDGAGVPGCC